MKFTASDSFDARRQALEDEFFYKRDQQLIQNLRNELAEIEEEHHLAHVSGVLEKKVLADLVHAGVTAESLLATRMIPMVAVAWSDHVISTEERAAILKAAAEDKILPGTASYDLLQHWLEARPRQEVVDAWRAYIHEFVKSAPPAIVAELKARTVRLCNLVATATASVLVANRITKDKQAIIDSFVRAWDGE